MRTKADSADYCRFARRCYGDAGGAVGLRGALSSCRLMIKIVTVSMCVQHLLLYLSQFY
jgi:hypothetical protein